MKNIRTKFEGETVKVVTKSGSVITGLFRVEHFDHHNGAVFTSATIEAQGSRTECKSAIVDVEDIEIIALLH